MITKLFAVCLLVNDLTKSREFYETKLGLKLNSEDAGFVDYQLRESPLALFEKKSATAMFPTKYMSPAGGAVIALQVDDVTQTCSGLQSQGVTIFEGPKTTPWGQTVAYLHDPDGHIIELTN